MGYYKGHYGKYSGNAKWSKDHAHTRVTKENYDASVADDAAHIDYLKRDVLYDDKHGHNDEKMTADEKHISKLAGDMKYDKKHHGSAAKHINKFMDENHQHNKNHDERPLHSHKNFEKKKKNESPAKHKRTGAMARHEHIRPGETKTEFRNRLSGTGKDGGKYAEKLRNEYIKSKNKNK